MFVQQMRFARHLRNTQRLSGRDRQLFLQSEPQGVHAECAMRWEVRPVRTRLVRERREQRRSPLRCAFVPQRCRFRRSGTWPEQAGHGMMP